VKLEHRVIVEVLNDAYRRQVPLSQAALDRIKFNKARLRVHRQMARECKPLFREMQERTCKRLLNDNKRVRQLIKTYESWKVG
jgi:hypothetical protein